MRPPERLQNYPFHPILLAAFPALALYANNLGQVEFTEVLRPLVVSIILGLLTLALIKIRTTRWQLAGLLASWILLSFFSYGQVYEVVKGAQIFGFLIGRHRYLLGAYGILIGIGVLGIARLTDLRSITRAMNVIAILLFVLQLSRIVIYSAQTSFSRRTIETPTSDAFLLPRDQDTLPDIYLIILDMYGRNDALQAHYGYNNDRFVSRLEALGFYVAECARSNYSKTNLSMGSQLNLDYIENLVPRVDHESAVYLMQHSLVRQSLENVGYTSIAFATGAGWANIRESDIFYDAAPDNIDWFITPFEELLVKGTLLRPVFDLYLQQVNISRSLLQGPIELKAYRIMLVLERLRSLPSMRGPKFVYAHIVAPHPPHVFNPDGSVNPHAENIDGQVGLPIQLDYLNPKFIEVVETILEDSENEPIIILEGDHGFADLQRNSILNAIYLPGEGEHQLYPTITSVNVFRVIFNEYFGTQLPLLPDASYKQLNDISYDYELHDEWNPACIP